jgi:hypothetical protein
LESIYSLFLHIQQPDHGLDSSFERGLFLKFPSFKTQAIIGRDNIYLDFTPVSGNSAISICSVSSSTTSSPICRKNSDYQNALHSESEYLDSLLLKLKEYYATVKTKHQLNLEVPAGFRKTSNINRMLSIINIYLIYLIHQNLWMIHHYYYQMETTLIHPHLKLCLSMTTQVTQIYHPLKYILRLSIGR